MTGKYNAEYVKKYKKQIKEMDRQNCEKLGIRDEKKERKCLRCQKMFDSKSRSNRICSMCKWVILDNALLLPENFLPRATAR